MSIKTVLFDLDGTLLPMDQDEFVKAYFGLLAKKLAPHGYAPELLIKSIWKGTAAMVKNSGGKTNEEVFWDSFAEDWGEDCRSDEPIFEEYYRTDFRKVREVCGYTPKAAELIAHLKSKNLRIILATNPIFPAIATQSRIGWAGMQPEDFEYITTYENSRHCKPNPEYYSDILKHIGACPEDCIMVGNDVREDMVAAKLGMKVFLLTDCIINKDDEDISKYPNGSFDELIAYLDSLI